MVSNLYIFVINNTMVSNLYIFVINNTMVSNLYIFVINNLMVSNLYIFVINNTMVFSCRTLASERTSIHKNLVVAIGLAQIIFLAGIDVVYNPVSNLMYVCYNH
jgi:hypothetical protein